MTTRLKVWVVRDEKGAIITNSTTGEVAYRTRNDAIQGFLRICSAWGEWRPYYRLGFRATSHLV